MKPGMWPDTKTYQVPEGFLRSLAEKAKACEPLLERDSIELKDMGKLATLIGYCEAAESFLHNQS